MITPGALALNATILDAALVDWSGSAAGGSEFQLTSVTGTFIDTGTGHVSGSAFVIDKAGTYVVIPSVQLVNQNAGTGGYTLMQFNAASLPAATGRNDGYIKGVGGQFNAAGVPNVHAFAALDSIAMRGFHDDGANVRTVSARVLVVRIG